MNSDEIKRLRELAAALTPERIESAQAALSDFCHVAWHPKGVKKDGKSVHIFSIPADGERDADIRIGRVLRAAGGLDAIRLLDHLEALHASHARLLEAAEGAAKLCDDAVCTLRDIQRGQSGLIAPHADTLDYALWNRKNLRAAIDAAKELQDAE